MSKALILRTCTAAMTGTHRLSSGFIWPESGPVEAPDWDPTPECGHGLHGLLWGEGDAGYLSQDTDAKWLVVEVEAKDVVDIGEKVKFPRGNVVFCGSKEEAIAYLVERAPGKAVVYGHVNVGDRQIAVAGDYGTATAGDRGTATAGDYGTATAGHEGTATAGKYGTATAGIEGTATAGDRGTAAAGYSGTATAGHGGTATAGDSGTATAGNYGKATAGNYGTATAGVYGTATAGYRGTATAGEGGILNLLWWDSKAQRRRIATFYVGENGIEANIIYKVDENGLPVEQNV